MPTTLDIVVPVYNEERALPASVARLVDFIARELPHHRARVLLCDNGSRDATPRICRELAAQHAAVDWMSLPRPGRGYALRQAWLNSRAEVVSYMDVDLSADLGTLPVLLNHVEDGWDVMTGSRHARGARVERSWQRDVVSRGYNVLVRSLFTTALRDCQCGFKVLRGDVARRLAPLVLDDSWFFDTELLLLAERLGYRVGEVGLRWVEDTDSRVHIVSTAAADLRGLARLRLGGLERAARTAQRRGGSP